MRYGGVGDGFKRQPSEKTASETAPWRVGAGDVVLPIYEKQAKQLLGALARAMWCSQ